MNVGEEVVENSTLAAKTARQGAVFAEFEKRRLSRSIAVPTDDKEVRSALRKRGEPVCLFGEDAHDRRERLRGFLVEELVAGVSAENDQAGKEEKTEERTQKKTEEEEEFYTEGCEYLKELRKQIARGSLLRTAKRIQRERKLRGEGTIGDEARARLREAEYRTVSNVADMGLVTSCSGSARPLTCISTVGNCVITGALDGAVTSWSLPKCVQTEKLESHSARVSNVRLDVEGRRLLSCSTDKTVQMFIRNERERFDHRLHTSMHAGRVADAQFHPWLADMFVTAGYDGRFVFSNIDKGVLLTQDTGHIPGVHGLAFDEDGGLLVTGGLEGGIRLWDLRSGRCILTFQGAHAESVLSLGFRRGSGRILVSCSSDHSCKVWDLRRMKPVWTIPAHHGIVSGMGFLEDKEESELGALGLVTSGYDGKVKVWAARRGWAFVKGWSCEARIMGVDVGEHGIVGAGWDKKWRWWGLSK